MFLRRSAKPSGTATDGRSLRHRVKGAGRAVRAAVFVLLALFALTLAAPGTAAADFSCSFTGDDAYELDSPGANGESVFPAVNQWENEAQRAKNLNDTTGMVTGAVNMPKSPDQYTMYEINAVRGMNWSGTQRDIGDASQTDSTWDASGADNCKIMDYVNNGIANLVFDGTKTLTRIAISIKEFASNPSPLSGLYTGRDNVVDTLKTKVFVPAVPLLITLTGIWVFTKWRKGEMREAWSGISWSALTTIAVVALLTGGNFHKFINEADAGIAQANSYLTEAVLSGMADEMQPPCDLPSGAPNRGLRESSCAMYDTLSFRPWALGQFGEDGTNCIFKRKDGGKVVNGTCQPASASTTCDYGKGARCEDLRVRQLVSQSMTNYDIAKDVSTKDKYKKDWYGVRQDMAGGKGSNQDEEDPKKRVYPVAFDLWAGHEAGNRIGIAVYSLIAALIVGIMVIVLSALTLLWHAVTLIMIIMLPLIATIGIHPSQQKLLKGWLQTFIHSFVLRAGFGVILTVLLVLYQMILPAKISLGMQLLMLLLVTVAVVMMLKKLLSGAYSPQIAGAQDALGVGDMAETVSGKLGQYGAGAAGGVAKATGRVAGGAAAGAGRAARKTGAASGRGLDNLVNKGRLQKGGWIAPRNGKRDQRRRAAETAEVQKDQYEQMRERRSAQEGSESGQSSESERVSGRVSGQQTPPPPPAPSAPTPASTPTPAPAPAPVPQQAEPARARLQAPEPTPAPAAVRPAAPRPASGRNPAPDTVPTRAQQGVPDPRRAPAQPQPQQPAPRPAPQDGESRGRVSE
ncbi:hypothetical protein [Streptomyces sp. NPDC059708]|uniref:hypothetical protein n=1 Tax=Streptomyces sp. NPDC059708 TaxID=3346916 RepID=UPI0036796444